MEKLKDCPFCGGKAQMWTSGNQHANYTEYRVCCMKCHVTQAGQWYYTEKDAVTAWNRRVNDGQN